MINWVKIVTELLFHACWDTSKNIGLWQLQKVSSVFNDNNKTLIWTSWGETIIHYHSKYPSSNSFENTACFETKQRIKY